MNRFPLRMFSSICFTFILAMLVSSCGDSSQQKAKPVSVSNYIYAYTSGVISKASEVRIRFVSDMIKPDEVGNEVESGVFSLSPTVKGKVFWQDQRTMTFEPENYFQSAKTYKGSINLTKLFDDLPTDLRMYEFEFQTQEQYFNISLEGLQIENINEPADQIFKGVLTTADIADNEQVEQLLVANQGPSTLPITWNHSPSQKRHTFTIKDIKRKEKDSQLNLVWDGRAMGLDNKGKEEVFIPAIGNFKVLETKLVTNPEQHILIIFSDPLQARQDLEGLINIEDYNGGLRYSIDGQQIRVYPSRRIVGSRRITIEQGIKNFSSKKMPNQSEWDLYFEDVKPGVRLVGKGVIIPNSEGLIFPFEALGLTHVDVEIHKIFDNNILQFLQTNELEGTRELNRVGRIILQKKVDLKALANSGSVSSWTRYALDLAELINQDPGAIYQVIIGFRPEYAVYSCGEDGEEAEEDNLTLAVSQEDPDDYQSIWGNYYGIGGYYDNYRWEQRDDPCFPAYYNYERFIRQNVFASNLGLIAKKGKDKSYLVAVTDLRTAAPMAGVQIDFYDYQQQLIKTTSSDGEGMVFSGFKKKTPFFIVAKTGDEVGYLRLNDNNSLSLSRFDVSGVETQKGMKGYLYGERGVWRPGDSLYLNFILEHPANDEQENHPVTFEFFDPRGQLQERRVVVNHTNYVYPFHIKTNESAPTGNWALYAKVGGASFYKNIKVETVKPNRLKIKLDFGKEELLASDKNIKGDLQVNWLHGAPARNLDTRIELQLKSGNTTFSKFSDFEFDDPARQFYAEPQVVFDKKVSAEGKATINASVETNDPPGKLTASFRTRVFEKGGDFSVDNFTMPLSPYKSYAGISIPENKYGYKRLNIDNTSELNFVAVDENGNPLNGKQLSIGLYRVNWRWWWDRSENRFTQYNSSNHLDALKKQEVTTNSKGEASWDLEVNQWGRYMVRVCDQESGHCSGDFFYAGYPWYGDEGVDRQQAAMLGFMTDKKKYEVGETVKLTIPAGEKGQCLISLESGTKVIETHWIETQKGENVFSFYATEAMAPTVYAHVTLIQPHGQNQNDLPIRLYGVVPVEVEDPETRISPQITMPDELEPEQTFKVEVKEEKGKPMAYTLAIVDEGLLDLTRFQTPDPWGAFYAREALGVKTWDLYDYVLGAYGGELERILSIGGGVGGAVDKDAGIKRFKPVVKHLGPFYLNPGKKAVHEITIPNYIGSVRVMVVGANQGAYGNAEKTVPVKKPLMVLATLPRVLGPTESLSVPVNVFVSDKNITNVSVTIEELSNMATFDGGKTRQLTFSGTGDQMVYFPMTVAERIGPARFKITAKGGREESTQEIELSVRNPNPIVTEIKEKVLQPGETWGQTFNPVGVTGTNTAMLEISDIPSLNLDQRLRYLLRYPYGCIEQTVSSSFPQLFLSNLTELSKDQQEKIEENIIAAINRLRQFQTASGGFSYWPGGMEHSFWGTNYAGHFLVEAKAKGYNVPETILNRWTDYQAKVAKRWDPSLEGGDNQHLTQAYRLYTLALAGKPEMGAMNRLREMDSSLAATWRLAGAYAAAGKTKVAKELTTNLDTDVADYRELGYTYGSSTRDQAMILEILVLIGDQERAAKLLQKIAKDLGNGNWMSTQATGYSLLAISKYVGDNALDDKFTFNYQIEGQEAKSAGAQIPIFQLELDPEQSRDQNVSLTNTSEGVLFVRLIASGQPLIGDQTQASNDLNMSISYKNMEGESLDISKLTQGMDFVAEVKVSNPGNRGINYQEMALHQVFPSGWEILNARMTDIEGVKSSTPEYQDIRDDRVYTFFDLRMNRPQTYRLQLNAAYQGRFYLPTIFCKAMYDESVNARKPGQWVEVLSPEIN